MFIYYIFLFLSSLLIFKKTTLVLTVILLNINYICHILNNTINHDILKYMLVIIIGVILVFRQDVILPFSMIYIFLFILYQVENMYNFFGNFNAIV
jgi:hypothetical protein